MEHVRGGGISNRSRVKGGKILIKVLIHFRIGTGGWF